MTSPLVSVLVAVYKTNEKHLKECIDSILNQTYRNFELLILDDCPADKNVKKVVESYNDARIFYRQNKKNLGISKTRNELMKWARGKYYAVMDHDDIMMPKRLETQVHYMELHSEVGICGARYKYFGNWKKRGVVVHPEASDIIKAGLFFKCTMHHPSIMIRADVIKKHKIVYNSDYVSANDRHLYLDTMPYAEFCNLPVVLMKYRIHKGMTSKQKRQVIVAEQKSLRQEMLKKMGAQLSNSQETVLNDFALKGRCRIRDKKTLEAIEKVFRKLDFANQKSGYFPKEAFSKICAGYFVKRCLNAAVWGRISSQRLLKQTILPVQNVKMPFLLKLLNYLLPVLKEPK